jgi:hypothetical protein
LSIPVASRCTGRCRFEIPSYLWCRLCTTPDTI